MSHPSGDLPELLSLESLANKCLPILITAFWDTLSQSNKKNVIQSGHSVLVSSNEATGIKKNIFFKVFVIKNWMQRSNSVHITG